MTAAPRYAANVLSGPQLELSTQDHNRGVVWLAKIHPVIGYDLGRQSIPISWLLTGLTRPFSMVS